MRSKTLKLILAIIILGATASVCLAHWSTSALINSFGASLL
ncbi:hypothetical protein ACFQET_01375 [Levilactobacillus tangyuanensis]|uniref:Uncharacterized protein n=1 Tax=Levilactobacillus tangyuanensis TaxID=2486021 RepID=A0ABW1TK61_9LACO|nr:hypothetical protein [Levilactobacillus tangyuanensis]